MPEMIDLILEVISVAKKKDVSIFISFLLRHHPEILNLDMDKHGWVSVEQLIDAINENGQYQLDFEKLCDIVARDSKGRYRFDETKSKIRACQGHSISWVEPELQYMEPPKYLYHGTTVKAWHKIEKSGYISKMARHAVHTQEDVEKAWQSALRWHLEPVVLKIDAAQMHQAGIAFGKSDNDVWCVESVPVQYIVEKIYK